MTIDREMLAAYAENQLDADGRAQVEAAIAADPALADEVTAHRALRARLQAHFAPVLDMPVPDRLLNAVRTPSPMAEVVDLNAVRKEKASRRPALTRWITGGAMAASLALGVLLGGQIPDRAPIGSADGQLVAQGKLDKALTTQLAASDSGAVRIRLSLRNREGRYCRVFETDAMAGLACRGNGHWTMERLQSGGSGAGGQYRQAGSTLGDIMAAAQAMAPEGAMNREQEKAAVEKSWE